MATVKPNEASEEFGLQRRRQSIPKAKRESTYSVYMCLCLTGHVRPVLHVHSVPCTYMHMRGVVKPARPEL